MDSKSLIGKQLKGYELTHLIGTGGFGAVYRAQQQVVGREVAVKVVLPQYANSPQFVRRFEAEAQFVARLEHPHIVPLFDYWRDPAGAYLVMRFIRGGSLSQALQTRTFSLEQISRFLDEITAALSIAHRNSVVHLDLKPDNIMFDQDGNAYLTDFGIARSMNSATQTGEENLSGTVAYASPEQIQGKPSPSPQSDIYSLGLILYQMLTGDHPYGMDITFSHMVIKQISEPVGSATHKRPTLPDVIDQIIDQATAKDPAQRYEDVRQISLDFKRLVLQQDLSLSTVEYIQVHTEISNPFKGLRSFEESDAQDFFGREDLTTQLIAYLMSHNFLAVVGPSGSGKSSLVKAGIVPALRRGALTGANDWYIGEFVPGGDAIGNLANALDSIAVRHLPGLVKRLRKSTGSLLTVLDELLSDQEGQVLLVIDQFEEIFTQASSEADRIHFLELLREAVRQPGGRLRVVITLRADFYDRPLRYEGFGSLVKKNTEVVLPLSLHELERAIQGPLERVGLSAAPELIAAIIADVREEPGALPLLQYALTEVFERREGDRLTLAAYTETGGVSGALAKRAEEVYTDLPNQQKRVARQVFLRMVTLGEGSEDTRRRARYSELMALGAQATVQAVLDVFGRYRLLTFDTDPETREPLVEVAHEALIGEWRRLTNWLAESRDDIRRQRLLDAAAAEWRSNGGEASFLLRGTRLTQYEEWAAETDLQLTDDENEFLQTSIAERQRLEQIEQERQDREQTLEARAQSRLRLIAVLTSIATVIGIVLTVLVFQQSRETSLALATSEFNEALAKTQVAVAATAEYVAAREANIAADQAARAQSLALSTAAQLSLLDGELDTAAALAHEANQLTAPPLQSQLILAQVAYSPGTRHRFEIGSPVSAVSIDDAGQTVLSGSRDGVLATWDVTSSQVIRTYQGHTERISAVALAPNGDTLISGSWDDTAIIWEANSGAIRHRLVGHADNVMAVAYNADGTQAATAGNDNVVRLWDVATGAELGQLIGHDAPIFSVAFSSEGDQVLTGSADDTTRLWDATTGEELAVLTGHTERVNAVAFGPRGDRAVTASDDGTIRIYNLFTQNTIGILNGHDDRVMSVTYTQDGRYIISGDRNGVLLIWNAQTREVLYRLNEHTGSINNLHATPNGKTVATGSSDGSIRVWSVEASGPLRTPDVAAPAGASVAFDPSGDRWLLASPAGGLQFYEANGNYTKRIRNIGMGTPVLAFAMSETGALVAAATAERNIAIWETTSGEALLTFERAHTGTITALAFAPGERLVLSGSADATVALWDTVTGERVHHFTTGHEDAVRAVAFSPDGRRAISGSNDGSIVLWDLDQGREYARVIGIRDAVSAVAFAPDGQTFFGALGDGTIREWDVNNMLQAVRQFEGHRGAVESMAFSPAFDVMLSADSEGNLILWDIPLTTQINRFATPPVREISFAADGQRALTVSNNGTVKLWRTLSLQALPGWIMDNRYLPELTCEQRDLYNIQPLCASQ